MITHFNKYFSIIALTSLELIGFSKTSSKITWGLLALVGDSAEFPVRA